MKIDYFYITFTFVSRYAFKLICHITNLLQKFSHQFLLRVKKRGNKSLSRRHHFSNQTYFEGTKKKTPGFFYRSDLFSISFYSFIHNFACAVFYVFVTIMTRFMIVFDLSPMKLAVPVSINCFKLKHWCSDVRLFFSSADGCIRWKTGRNCDEIARVTICYFIMMTMMVSSKCTSFSKLTWRKLQFETEWKAKWMTQPYILLTFDNGRWGDA